MCSNIQPDFPLVCSRHADIWQAHAPIDLARFKQLLLHSLIWFLKSWFHVFNFSNTLSGCLLQTCWHLVGPRAYWPSTLQTMDGPGVLLLRHCAINWITSPIGLHGVGIARVSCISSNQSREIEHSISVTEIKGKTVLPTRRGSPSFAWGILGSPGTLPSQQQSSSSLPEHKVQWIRLS